MRTLYNYILLNPIYNLKYSLVFTTMTSSIDGTTKSLGLLGKEWNVVKKNWNMTANSGIYTQIGSIFQSSDIVQLREYNKLVQNGMPITQAFGKTLKGCSSEVGKVAFQLGKGNISLKEAEAQLKATSQSTALLTAKTLALNIAVNAGIMAVITLAYKVFDYLIHRSEKLAEAFATIKDEINSLQDTLKEHSELIDQVVEKYDTFAKGVNLKTNANIGLSDEEYKEFIDTSNQLAEIYPELVKGYDAQGNAILDLGNNADEAKYKLNELYQTEKDFANIDILSKVDESFKAVKNDITNLMLCEVTFN